MESILICGIRNLMIVMAEKLSEEERIYLNLFFSEIFQSEVLKRLIMKEMNLK